MKRTFLMLSAILCGCGIGWSQGMVNFANAAAGLNAPIIAVGPGVRLVGTAWIAQLWYGPAGSTEATLIAHPTTATFSTIPAQDGYFSGGPRTIPGIPGGAIATLQVRVWYFYDGATWEEAMMSGRYGLGASSLFNVTLTSPPASPANLTGLTSFLVYRWPEPTSGALLVVGGLVFAWWRRVEKRRLALEERRQSSIKG